MTNVTTEALDRQEQLKAYEIGLKETDQIIAIRNHMATVANLLLLVTGAIWAAIHAEAAPSVKPTASCHPSAPGTSAGAGVRFCGT